MPQAAQETAGRQAITLHAIKNESLDEDSQLLLWATG